MVRKLFVIMIVLLGSAFINVSAQESRNYRLNLQVGIVDPTSTQGGHPRGPILMPEACLDGYTLYFYNIGEDFTLQVVDDEENVVYSTYVHGGTASVILPSYLEGEYELRLVTESRYLYGWINL